MKSAAVNGNQSSLLLLTAVFFMLLLSILFRMTGYNDSVPAQRHCISEISVSSGVSGTVQPAGFNDINKTWFPNKGNLRILSLAKTSFSENRKAESRIQLLEHIREAYFLAGNPSFKRQLYPSETDQIPVLS
jgi:hypothetical protein